MHTVDIGGIDMAIRKTAPQLLKSFQCSVCGDPYNYIFINSLTVAFCPNYCLEKLDEVVFSLDSEIECTHIELTCKS
ncbi:hypothetical protein C9J12_26825 [Photobacterium frigidiphilum]|uniref:Uncharacterized protein n=1 Tax=Photobacterium frigidiphilum TaxID=264736 RepID=A0A2T3J726_9GAMM|nr:hypothetical protein C9J12_26825 [Photobacterium frigidiphilum]